MYKRFSANIFILIYGNTAQKIKFSIKDFFSKCDQTLNSVQCKNYV